MFRDDVLFPTKSDVYTYFQVHDIEYTQIEMNVMSSLEKGNEALKKMHRVGYLL